MNQVNALGNIISDISMCMLNDVEFAEFTILTKRNSADIEVQAIAMRNLIEVVKKLKIGTKTLVSGYMSDGKVIVESIDIFATKRESDPTKDYTRKYKLI